MQTAMKSEHLPLGVGLAETGSLRGCMSMSVCASVWWWSGCLWALLKLELGSAEDLDNWAAPAKPPFLAMDANAVVVVVVVEHFLVLHCDHDPACREARQRQDFDDVCVCVCVCARACGRARLAEANNQLPEIGDEMGCSGRQTDPEFKSSVSESAPVSALAATGRSGGPCMSCADTETPQELPRPYQGG